MPRAEERLRVLEGCCSTRPNKLPVEPSAIFLKGVLDHLNLGVSVTPEPNESFNSFRDRILSSAFYEAVRWAWHGE